MEKKDLPKMKSRMTAPVYMREDEEASAHYIDLYYMVERYRQPTMIDMQLIEKASMCHSNIRRLECSISEVGMYIHTASGEPKRNGMLQDLKGVRDSYLKFMQELGLTAKILATLNKGKPQDDGKFSY